MSSSPLSLLSSPCVEHYVTSIFFYFKQTKSADWNHNISCVFMKNRFEEFVCSENQKQIYCGGVPWQPNVAALPISFSPPAFFLPGWETSLLLSNSGTITCSSSDYCETAAHPHLVFWWIFCAILRSVTSESSTVSSLSGHSLLLSVGSHRFSFTSSFSMMSLISLFLSFTRLSSCTFCLCTASNSALKDVLMRWITSCVQGLNINGTPRSGVSN